MRAMTQMRMVAITIVAASVAIAKSDSHGSERPSFDCGNAVAPIDLAICSHPTLAAQDRKLAAAYSVARGRTRNPKLLIDEQRKWIARRHQNCKDFAERESSDELISCLLTEGEKRLASLPRPPANWERCLTIQSVLQNHTTADLLKPFNSSEFEVSDSVIMQNITPEFRSSAEPIINHVGNGATVFGHVFDADGDGIEDLHISGWHGTGKCHVGAVFRGTGNKNLFGKVIWTDGIREERVCDMQSGWFLAQNRPFYLTSDWAGRGYSVSWLENSRSGVESCSYTSIPSARVEVIATECSHPVCKRIGEILTKIPAVATWPFDIGVSESVFEQAPIEFDNDYRRGIMADIDNDGVKDLAIPRTFTWRNCSAYDVFRISGDRWVKARPDDVVERALSAMCSWSGRGEGGFFLKLAGEVLYVDRRIGDSKTSRGIDAYVAISKFHAGRKLPVGELIVRYPTLVTMRP